MSEPIEGSLTTLAETLGNELIHGKLSKQKSKAIINSKETKKLKNRNTTKLYHQIILICECLCSVCTDTDKSKLSVLMKRGIGMSFVKRYK